MPTGWLYWENDVAVAAVEKSLKDGDIILGNSDTVFGLLASCSQKGFDALNAIKRRSEKPYLILIDSLEKLDHFIEKPLTSKMRELITTCWPGPLTIIFKAKKDLPAYLQSVDGTIALRMPAHQGLLQLLSRFEDGLFSTSANLTDQPLPDKIEEVDPTIMHAVHHVIINKKNIESNLPSTIIDCSSMPIKIIREGAFSKEQLEKFL